MCKVKKISEPTKQIICDLYQAGKKPLQIAKFLSVSDSTVNRVLRQKGIPPIYESKSIAGKKGAKIQKQILCLHQKEENKEEMEDKFKNLFDAVVECEKNVIKTCEEMLQKMNDIISKK